MTGEEKDAQLGAIFREYKEASDEVACLAVGIGRAASALSEIDKLLKKRSETQLAGHIRHVDIRDVEAAPDRIEAVQRALDKRDALRIQLNELGFRDLLKS